MKKKMKPVYTLALLAALTPLALAGCTKREDRILFEGVYFPAKAKAVHKKVDRRDFTVEVKDAGVKLSGARAAGAYQGTRYCIENYGTSRIDWVVGPETPITPEPGPKGTLVLQGKCRP